MAAAERRRGRRDNGLDATDWRAIQDLDPRMAEDVLDLLATRGIAAYVQPAVDVDPVTRSATLPSRPSDRLFVDRKRVEAARDCVRTLLGDRRPGSPDDLPGEPAAAGDDIGGGPEASGGDAAGSPGAGASESGQQRRELDATFAGIVAGFDRQVDPTAADWPAAENVEPAAGRSPAQPGGGERSWTEPPLTDPPGFEAGAAEAEPARPAGPIDARDVTEPSLLDALDTFGADLPDEEPPEKFVPPPPPPLPRLSQQTVLGWVAIVVGLLLLIGRPDFLPLDRSSTMLLGFAGILGGAVALILRLRPGTEPDDQHPDDGAKV